MMTGKKILGITIAGAIGGTLLGLFFVGASALGGIDFEGWLFGGMIGAITVGLLCLELAITRKLTEDKTKIVKRMSLVFVGIIGLIVSYYIAYFLTGVILGLTIWRNI